jgi:GT2 family glycosyltransferase
VKIAVVVLHFRHIADTLECLDSLARQDYPHFEIVLVDNGSQDRFPDIVQKRPGLVFIKNKTNLGFAEGNNIGIRCALERGADGVLLLNNDTTCHPHVLSSFAKAAQTYPDAAAFGAKIYFYDEPTVSWHAGGGIHFATLRCYHEGYLDCDLEKKYNEVRDIGYACGCALFMTREAIKKVGLLDPRFFLIWEEIDWCFRMRKAGYRCLYIPEATVWHKISRAFDGGNRGALWHYYYFRNRLLFIKKQIPLKKRICFYMTTFLKELCQIIYFSFIQNKNRNQKKLNRAALKGIGDYFLRRFY